MPSESSPRPSLYPHDVVAIVIGLVVGAGIFKAPAMVAANAGSEPLVMLAWMFGGAVSLLGALCYAELAAAYPDAGGEYRFLSHAYGRSVGFLFGWSRMAVLQTGSIALLAFVFGDYLARLLPMGENGPSWYAAAVVFGLTALNIVGLHVSRTAQNGLTIFTLIGLVVVVVAGFLAGADADAAGTAVSGEPAAGGSFGLAMIFVLLTYGGWNEAAYVSAELRDVGRNMARVLVFGIGGVTVLYLLVNLSYLNAMGLDGVSGSEAVTADVMQAALGKPGAQFVSVLIVLAVAASINVTILTGARTNYALARDFRLFRFLGGWQPRRNAPVNALWIQGVIALALVGLGSRARSGFEAMVEFVSPVFWLFFLLTVGALFVLRLREPARVRPFRVPGYPLTPLIFMAACAYMLYSSVAYTGMGALVGVVLLAAGVPLLLWDNRRRSITEAEGDIH